MWNQLEAIKYKIVVKHDYDLELGFNLLEVALVKKMSLSRDYAIWVLITA